MFRISPRMQINVIPTRNRLKSPKFVLKRVGCENKITCNVTCRENFRQYLFNTTLHGLKYVGDNTISIIER